MKLYYLLISSLFIQSWRKVGALGRPLPKNVNPNNCHHTGHFSSYLTLNGQQNGEIGGSFPPPLPNNSALSASMHPCNLSALLTLLVLHLMSSQAEQKLNVTTSVTEQCNATLHYITLQCTTLHCTTMH